MNLEELLKDIADALWEINTHLETIAESAQYASGECPIPGRDYKSDPLTQDELRDFLRQYFPPTRSK